MCPRSFQRNVRGRSVGMFVRRVGQAMAVSIRCLGDFAVSVDDVPVPQEAWSRRQSASLVKLLALAPGHRLHRERVIDALWPGLSVDTAAPRLHKAAHYARRALGDDVRSLVLRQDSVALLPDATVVVDVAEFLRVGSTAVAEGTQAAAESALDLYTGQVLPQDLYEPWAQETRDAVQPLHLDLLRLARRWEDLLSEDPVDE